MERPKVERKISLGIYVTALVLTVLVFSLGIYVGMVIDESAKMKVEGELAALEQDLYLSRILMLVEDEMGEYCPIYGEKLSSVDAERELIGDRIEYLESVRGLRDESLRERYYYLEFENYLLMKKMQKDCGSEYVLVLFFYGEGEASIEQGKVLDSLRAKNSNIKVFSFEGASESAVVKALKSQYSVGGYPAVIVDGKKLSGAQSLAQLESAISST